MSSQVVTLPDTEFKEAPLSPQVLIKRKELLIGGQHLDLKTRGISQATCTRFDVKVVKDDKDGRSKIVYPYMDKKTGALVAQKTRSADKQFMCLGEMSKAGLFAQWLFPPNPKQTLTIVEGEQDALAIYEMMGDWPVVSIKNGSAAAVKDIKDSIDYISGFKNVVICFDADEAGQAAAKEAVKVLPFGRTKQLTLTRAKDANDYLLQGLKNEFMREWFAAPLYGTEGILDVASLREAGLVPLEPSDITYPFETLNALTYGIRPQEMVTISAGTGVGKSAFIKQLIVHLLDTTDMNMGLMFYEEGNARTVRSLVGTKMGKAIHLPGVVYTKEEYYAAFDALFSNPKDKDASRVKMISDRRFGSNDIDFVCSQVEILSKVFGCKVILLDHISILVSDQQSGDERKALDMIATRLRTLAQALDICLVIVSHLRRPSGTPHEEGGQTSLGDLRGTAGIGQLSDIVLGLERDGQSPDEYVRNTTKIRVLKNRYAGETGLTSYVTYDRATNRLTETDPEVYEQKAEEATQKKKAEKKAMQNFDSEFPVFDNTNAGAPDA